MTSAYDEFEVRDPAEFDPAEDEAEVDYLTSSCRCGWSGMGMFWKGDGEDLNQAKSKLQEEHKTKKPHCTLQISFG